MATPTSFGLELIHADMGPLESVADHCKKPLFRIDAGMLGATASSVETNLATSLDLATRWKAVALIDEADVFLEERSTSSLARNTLVAGMILPLNDFYSLTYISATWVRCS